MKRLPPFRRSLRTSRRATPNGHLPQEHRVLRHGGNPRPSVSDWEDSLPEDIYLAYLPNPLTGVRLRLSIYGGVKEEEEKRIDAEFERLKPLWVR